MPDVSLIVADPGHFHAALVQKEMYPNLSPEVHVYAPLGPDLADYLTRIARFNTRKEQPTHWKLEVHAGPDFLERMCRERLGTIAIFSGRNRGKVRRIQAAIDAGINVLADKPVIIRRDELPVLEAALDAAEELCVRWCLRFKLSLRDPVEMMAERGLSMAHTTIMRWVQRYAPEFRETLATVC
jgi:hypothetical protein